METAVFHTYSQTSRYGTEPKEASLILSSGSWTSEDMVLFSALSHSRGHKQENCSRVQHRNYVFHFPLCSVVSRLLWSNRAEYGVIFKVACLPNGAQNAVYRSCPGDWKAPIALCRGWVTRWLGLTKNAMLAALLALALGQRSMHIQEGEVPTSPDCGF